MGQPLTRRQFLDRTVQLIDRQHIFVHLQTTFFSGFGKPCTIFWWVCQWILFPRGVQNLPAWLLVTRVLELEAQLKVYVPPGGGGGATRCVCSDGRAAHT